MVTIADGRYSLPSSYLYSKTQHVFLDKVKKICGLDQIGYAFLKKPTEMQILVDKEVKVGEPFVAISTDKGISTLNSPCSGTLKTKHDDALEKMENDTYEYGILEFEEITEIDTTLITGADIEPWATHEVRSLLKNEYSFKVILTGDSAVGKTAIKVRFTDDYFKQDLKTTLGVDFGSKELKCEYLTEDILFSGVYRFTSKLNVWDAAGQSHYDKIRGMYYRDAKGALLVYDVNNPVSFDNLGKWIEELDENLGRVPTLLIGNKTDLERLVPLEKALEFAKNHGFLYAECSAKTGDKVENVFRKLAVEIYKKEENL